MSALVGVIMGSKSDWSTLSHTADMLEKLGIPHEVTVVSAHRTPDLLFQYAEQAEARGLRVIIAGAGGAAHLPGMCAAKTHLPVLGVPVQSSMLSGSIRCCPSCRCRPACRSPPWPSARLARSTPRCSRRASSATNSPSITGAEEIP